MNFFRSASALFLGVALTLFTVVGLSAQAVTTSTLIGRVTDQAGAPVPGAQIVIQNQATGAQQGTLTRADGRYIVPGLRPGGPYRLEARIIGYGTEVQENVNLTLGQPIEVDFVLAQEAVQIAGIDVTVEGPQAAGSGNGTVVSERVIEDTPSVGRELVDLVRLTPQVAVLNEDAGAPGGAFSIAGQTNRNNALFIDGVVQNDVFGLAASGTNGGQTGAPAVSFDAIEQMQIAISPFDVSQSGFVGGAVNAVTRSGTNDFEGSIYFNLRNETLAGETPGPADLFTGSREREKLPDFSNERYGFRLGGPIVENKAFFFFNGELNKQSAPQPFNRSVYAGDLTDAELEGMRTILQEETGYDPGGFLNRDQTLEDQKFLGKIDWQINDLHRLTARHNYMHATNVEALPATAENIYFSNNSEYFPTTTHSSALELNSRFGDNFINKFLVGATFVRDDRGFQGNPFPQVVIEDADADVRLGSEAFSAGNVLNQDIFTLTNNLTWLAGNHTVTFGTHNEFYSAMNLFLRENFGNYTYRSLDDFLQSVCAAGTGSSTYCTQLRAQGPVEPAAPTRYARGYSQLSNNLGDAATEAAASFDAFQLGFYIQDDFQASDRLRINAGVRLDVPALLDDPRAPADFDTTTLPLLEAAGIDLGGARPGEAPGAAFMFAPRVGFTYDLSDASILRGGAGIFTGRQQFVYPGAMFTNNGVTIGYYNRNTLNGEPIAFYPDPSQAPGFAEFGAARGELDIFEDDFVYPRVLRTSLGLDTQLPFGFVGTLEGQYTNTLSNLVVENVNFRPLNATLNGPDNRQIYFYGYDTRFNSVNVSATNIDTRYSHILKVGNTDEGYSYDVAASVQRVFGESLTTYLSYAYGDAHSVNDLTSSQIYSIWRFNPSVSGLNNLESGRSNFSLGHRALASVSYRQEFLDNLATTISAVYTGESGRPYTFIIGNNFGFTGEGSGTTPLPFIPMNASDLTFQSFTYRNSAGENVVVSPAEQAQAFEAFIAANDYLDSARGGYADKNALRAPFEHGIDLRIAQELFGNIGGRRNTLELTLDIMNFTNLLNPEWGRRYDVGFRTVDLLRFERYASATDLTPIYTFRLPSQGVTSMDDYWDNRLIDFGTYGSRWLMQLGLRYTL